MWPGSERSSFVVRWSGVLGILMGVLGVALSPR
jgi:hypothetical protein